MKNVVALFSEPTDADAAIKKLSEQGLDTAKARVHNKKSIESSQNVRPIPGAAAAVTTGGTTAGMTGGTAPVPGGAVMSDDNVESYLANIGIDGEAVAFFKRGIIDGGHVVLITVDNDDVEKAEKALADAGGRAPIAE